MILQQGINQLLDGVIRVAQPIVQRKQFILEQAESQRALQLEREEREKQSKLAEQEAFNMAQQESAKRVAEIMEATGNANMTDEQLEYATNLQNNAAKVLFERNPSPETMQNWYAVSATKEEVAENIALNNWRAQAEQKIRQEIAYDKLRKQIREKEGLTD